MLTCVQARIRDPNAATRTTVLSAIRYTFADSSSAFDDILAPYIIDFLSLMDTPSTPELNLWYHLLNAGFPAATVTADPIAEYAEVS